MTDAVIVDAVRTPGGKRKGMLAGWHPADLSALVLQELTSRNDLDPGLVEDRNGRFGGLMPDGPPPPERFAPFAPFIPCGSRPAPH